MSTHTPTSTTPRSAGLGIALIIVGAFALGMVVFVGLRVGIELLWAEIPGTLPQWARVTYVLAVPTLAGAAVAWLRQHEANGHSPLAGFAIEPVPGKVFQWLLGAVAVTLLGGIVLGPEMALVITGCAVATGVVHRGYDIPLTKALKIGVGAAILVLFVEPVLHGSFDVSPNYSFDALHVVGGAITAMIAAAVLALGRVAAMRLIRVRHHDRPDVLPMAIVGLAVGLLAVGYHLSTGQDEILVLTSGEGQIRELAALSTVGLIAFTTAIKWLSYSLSLGGGFRGGPYFPAIFVGAGVGLVANSLAPTWFGAAAAVGIVAAVVYLAHPKIPATIVLGLVIGLLVGGPQIIVSTVVGALVARLVPLVRFDDDSHSHPPTNTTAP
jgi:hypothetical protein